MKKVSFVVEQLIHVKGTVPWHTYMVKRKMMFTCQKKKIKVARIVIRVLFSAYFMAGSVEKMPGFFVFMNQGFHQFWNASYFFSPNLTAKTRRIGRCRQNCMVTKCQRTSILHCHEQFLPAPEEKMKQTQTPLIVNHSKMYQVRTTFWHNHWSGVVSHVSNRMKRSKLQETDETFPVLGRGGVGVCGCVGVWVKGFLYVVAMLRAKSQNPEKSLCPTVL